MRTRSALLTIGCALVLSAGDAAAQCRGADSTSTRMVGKYANLMRRAAAGGELRVEIARMGLTLVDPSAVSLVTDKAICAKAERAYSSALKGNGTTPSGSVYVVRVGTNYVVRDPAQMGSQYYVEMVLDSAYRIKDRFMS